jgi:hypothetical protein
MSQTFKQIGTSVLLVACVSTPVAFGPLDPGDCRIYQNGVRVGEIHVPGKASQSLYIEHWILYPTYVYPNTCNGIRTEIVPDTNLSYTSEADFFARAPFGPGFRYVRVTSNDPDIMPGRC